MTDGDLEELFESEGEATDVLEATVNTPRSTASVEVVDVAFDVHYVDLRVHEPPVLSGKDTVLLSKEVCQSLREELDLVVDAVLVFDDASEGNHVRVWLSHEPSRGGSSDG